DVLLECLDALEAAVDSIEADGTEHLDPAALNDRLQALIRAPEPAAAPAAAGARVVHVAATLTEDTLMPSVRAYMVLAAIAEHGELVASVPHHDDVEGFDGREIDAWLACDDEDDALVATVTGVADVASATAAELEAPAAEAPPAQAP